MFQFANDTEGRNTYPYRLAKARYYGWQSDLWHALNCDIEHVKTHYQKLWFDKATPFVFRDKDCAAWPSSLQPWGFRYAEYDKDLEQEQAYLDERTEAGHEAYPFL